MFLDSDGELSSEVSIETGLPIKRKKIHKQHHIVYKKKKGQHDDSFSDYGESNSNKKNYFFSTLDNA